MPRRKLSEYRSKVILAQALDLKYRGWPVDTHGDVAAQLAGLPEDISYAVKVDQAVKGRFKKGLVVLDTAKTDLLAAVQTLAAKGYDWLIIEPMASHQPDEERYLSISSDRGGLVLRYAEQGGIDIESHPETIKQVNLNDAGWAEQAAGSGFSAEQLQALQAAFTDNYFTFLEINPYLMRDGRPQLLDAAVEVDDAGAFFIDSWQADDFRHGTQGLSEAEQTVQELAENSPAAFSLNVLNPDGSIFLLLSGGGASVVVADEVYNQGYGQQLANYGEYSGNPNSEETYLYTQAVLSVLLASPDQPKVLFIGGAVANFTDIAKTFDGVIQAIDEVAGQLAEQGVKIFARRGGPNQAVGLQRLEAALVKHNLLGAVHDPSTPLTVAVREALEVVNV